MRALLDTLAKEGLSWVQLRYDLLRCRLTVAVALGVTLLALGVAGVVAERFDVQLYVLTRDPTAILRAQPWVGLLSNLGVILWSVAVGVAWVGATLTKVQGSPASTVAFYRFAGLLTLVLALDDVYLLHERVLPFDFHFPEGLVYFLYVAGFGFLLVAYWREITKTPYVLLLIALSGLGGSVLFDVVVEEGNIQTFVEDSFKLLGIVFWLAYFQRAVSRQLGSPPLRDVPDAGRG